MMRKRVWLGLLVMGFGVGAAWAASTYYATCADPSHKAGWDGDLRNKRSEAEADCAAHVANFPGHVCKVEEVIR